MAKMTKIDRQKRDAEIRASDEHWSVLAERFDLSRGSIYRIQADAPETYAAHPSRQRTQFKDVFRQTAVSGITRHGGQVAEEFQRELQEDGGAKIYTEMSVHPVVAAVMFAIKMSLRRVRWWMEPASDKPNDRRKAEFVDECREDMAQSWAEVVSQVFEMLKFGFQLCELVYKKRLGYDPPHYIEDPARSRFDDGLIGWRRWQFINPTSLTPGNQWRFDDYGRVQGFNQTPPPSYVTRYIPMEKALLFRTSVEWDNPEGVSTLRPMYQPWYYATNLAEVEAIGAERLGVGLPVMYLGDGCTFEGPNSDYAQAQDIVVNVRMDEQMGLVVPKPKMGAGAEPGTGMLFELVSPPSRGFVDFSEVIERYEKRMAMTVLAQFIFLGMRNVGTQALASTSTDFFVDAVGAWSDAMAGVINRFAIPRLMALNPFGLEDLPQLAHSEIGVPDLQTIAAFINQLVQAQVIMPYDELERHLLEIAGLPEKPEREPEQLEAPQKEQEPEQETPEGEEPEEPEEPPEEEPGEEEAAETFALRTAPGGPKWERATNAYQRELWMEWDDWADKTARELAQIEDEQERDKRMEEAVAAIIAALVILGRRRLPEAWALGLAGDPSSPEGLALLAEAIAGNETYLHNLGPAVVQKVRGAIQADPAILTDATSLRSVFGTMRARVGLYAGQFWNLIMRGAIDRVSQRPDASEVAVKWALDPNVTQHCQTCLDDAGEYENYEAMLARTGGVTPGVGTICDGNCRCSLLFKVPGKGWSRW